MTVRNRRQLAILVLAAIAGISLGPASWGNSPFADASIAYPATPIVDEQVEAIRDNDEASSLPEPSNIAAPHASSIPCHCCNSMCCTEKEMKAASAAMAGAYQGVFYANDFGYLNDRCYDGPSFPGDALKGLCCGKLDLGGEARVRFHDETNHRGLGVTGLDDQFWLTRLRLFANYRMNEYFRLYGEYLYADSGGEFFNNRPIEENRGEIQNLFLDTKLISGAAGDLTLRVGRQELLFGAQRLVAPLDWANTRRTFEGARVLYSGSAWNVDGFFVHPVNRIAANENKIDDANEDVDFFGVYATRKGFDVGTVDAYYLGLNNDTLDFDFHTLGTRVAGSSDAFLYELEGGVQFGTNSDGSSHDAGFFTGGLGKRLSICTRCGEWNPTIWLWYDWASGGNDINASRGDDSFDHLFPLAHKYLGLMDLYARRNINDVNAQFITPIMGSKVKLLLWYHYFFLDQKTTPYGVTELPYNPGVAAGDRELGHEIDVLFTIDLNPRNNVLLGYSFFNAGDYYDSTAGAVDVDAEFFYMQYQTRF